MRAHTHTHKIFHSKNLKLYMSQGLFITFVSYIDKFCCPDCQRDLELEGQLLLQKIISLIQISLIPLQGNCLHFDL